MVYLCDTCVLIDYLRRNPEVQQKLEQDKKQGLGMSSITYMELMVGALDKREAGIIKKAFLDFEIIEIFELISVKVRSLIEKYNKSYGILILDLLIGATALELALPLYTTNIKDFQFIPDLVLI